MRTLMLSALAVCLASGSDKINVYESDHFELITDSSKGRAQEILNQFERVRSFFAQVMALREPLVKPLVVVFHSEKDFREVAMNEVAAAYYAPKPNRDLIAIGAANRSGEMRSVVHEYLHMLVRHTEEGEVPIWMNEGIAELYSTIQPAGKKLQVGAPIPGHILLLRNEWLDLAQVLEVDRDSPIYNRRAHAGTFYAMSWALVHMLSLDKDYKAGYTAVAAGLRAGKPAAEVFQTVYGKSVSQVDAALRSYVRGNSVMTLLFNMQFDESQEKNARPATLYEWNLARAELLSPTRMYDAARQQLEALTAAEPTRPEAWESLAFLHWLGRQKGPKEAAFAKARELGSRNPQLAFHSPALTGDRKLSSAALQELVAAHPNYVDGHLRLAEELLYDDELTKSYDEVKKVKKINPKQAPHYFPVLIETTWRLNKLEECRIAASQYKKVARAGADQESAQRWFTYAMREPAPAPSAEVAVAGQPIALPEEGLRQRGGSLEEFLAEDEAMDITKEGNQLLVVRAKLTLLSGTLVHLECKDPQAILTIKSDAGLTRLLIEDPTNVNLTTQGEAKIELTCGPQSNRIKVGYFPRDNATEKTVGALATLEFLK